MNWEGYERKQSWPNFKVLSAGVPSGSTPASYLGGLRFISWPGDWLF
jgi:hypothetical protein